MQARSGRLVAAGILVAVLSVRVIMELAQQPVQSGVLPPSPGAPTASPIPVASFPSPVTSTTVAVPATIDATGKADASVALNAFIAKVADGSTITFKAGSVYRLDHGLQLDDRHDLVFEGNGATLKANGSGGRVMDSPFSLNGNDRAITIRGFTIVGNNPDAGTAATYHRGAEDQMAIVMYGAKDIEFDQLTISGAWGDCLYIGGSNADAVWSDGIWFHDSSCTLAGRTGVAITAASHVTIERVTFDKLGIHVLDIEPDSAPGGGAFITFRSNTVGTYALSSLYTGYFFAADGAPGSKVHDIAITGNTVAGNPHAGYDGSPRGLNATVELARRESIVFTDNTATVAVTGPALRFLSVDGAIVTGNTQPMLSGSFAKFTDCTGVTYQ